MRLRGFIWLVAFVELEYPRQTNACRHSQATSMGRYYHHWFWKDPADQSKGALWAYIHSDYASKYGIGTAAYTRSGPAPANGRYFFTASKNSRSKGKKWCFTMQDGSRFTCRTHTAASYVRVKAPLITSLCHLCFDKPEGSAPEAIRASMESRIRFR
jgi:hypothetical protein